MTTSPPDHLPEKYHQRFHEMTKKLEEMTNQQLLEFRQESMKPGIIYLPSLSPYINPKNIKHHLQEYGQINRVYLVEEDEKLLKKRKKSGGFQRRKYTKGWVEFLDKRDAKRAVEILNQKPIGGSRKKRYVDDLWLMKYLPEFTWDHLNQRKIIKAQIRNKTLREGVDHQRYVDHVYLSRVDKARKITHAVSKAQDPDAPVDFQTFPVDNPLTTSRLPNVFSQQKAKGYQDTSFGVNDSDDDEG